MCLPACPFSYCCDPLTLYLLHLLEWPGGFDHPPSSSAEVEGRVELYICSPSRPSWLVLGPTKKMACLGICSST